MKSIIEREATFENVSDIEVRVAQKNHHEHLQRKHKQQDIINIILFVLKVQPNTTYKLFAIKKNKQRCVEIKVQ